MKGCVKKNYPGNKINEIMNRIRMTKINGKSIVNTQQKGGLSITYLILDSVISKLGGNYATHPDLSKEPKGYSNSIDELVEDIISAARSFIKLNDPKKSLLYEDRIKIYLKNKLLPLKTTSLDESVEQLIGGERVMTESQEKNERLFDATTKFFGSYTFIEKFRRDRFSREVVLYTIFNPEGIEIDEQTKHYIRTQYDMNMSILQYLEKLYNIVRSLAKKILDEKNKNLEEEEKELINIVLSPNLFNKKGEYNPNWENALLIVYNYLLQNENIKDLMLSGYYADYSGRHIENEEYKAAMAYLNLRFFDLNLKLNVKIIKTDKSVKTPVIKYDDGQIVMKYSFDPGAGKAKAIYGKESHNFIDELPDFSKILIEQIPIWTYGFQGLRQNIKTSNYLSNKEFLGAMSKLLSVLDNAVKPNMLDTKESKDDPGGSEAVLKFLKAALMTDVDEKVSMALDALFNSKSNKSLIKLLFNSPYTKFTSNEINYLYSIYKTVFSMKQNDKSWKYFDIERQKQLDGIDGSEYSVYNTLINVIRSNTEIRYLLTKYDNESEHLVTSVKDKHVYNNYLYGLVDSINRFLANRNDKAELLDKYKITFESGHWTIEIPLPYTEDETEPKTFSIEVHAYQKIKEKQLDNGDILNKNNRTTADAVSLVERELFHNHDGKDPEIDFNKQLTRARFIEGKNLSNNERKLRAILTFINDMLGINVGADSQLVQLQFMLKENDGDLKEMFMTAVRALAITDLYQKFDEVRKDGSYTKNQVAKWLSDNDGIYEPYYFKSKDTKASYSDEDIKHEIKTYFKKHSQLGYVLTAISPYHADWVTHLSEAKAIMSGGAVKAVINDFAGNALPTFSPYYFGNGCFELLELEGKGNMETLMFSGNNRFYIVDKVVNEDIKLQSGYSMQVKSMSKKEWILDGFMNKFVISWVDNNGVVYMLPTVLSDKTKFVTYGINLDSLLTSYNIDVKSPFIMDQVIKVYGDTIGKFYEKLWQLTLKNFNTIFHNNDSKWDINSNWIKINQKLSTLSERDLLIICDKYNQTHSEDRIELKRPTHYRVLEGGKLALNELAYKYATGYFSKEKLNDILSYELGKYVNDLLLNRVSFTKNSAVISAFDKIEARVLDWFMDDLMVLALIRNGDGTINDRKVFGKIKGNYITKEQFLANLLLDIFAADVKGTDDLKTMEDVEKFLKISRSKKILDIYNKYKLLLYIEYNPLIKTYFLINGLVTNNLRLNLTGSEIGHNPNKYKNVLADMRQEVGKILVNEDVSNWSFMDLELRIFILETQNPLEISSQFTQLLQLRELSWKYTNYISVGANNTYYKRQAVIPATMRPFLTDRLNGIGLEYNIAVIDDVEADIFNFSGESDKKEAHDGAVWITGYVADLENNSLQDGRQGPVRKPIYHGIDVKTGCATFIKCASNTLTNTIMRQSEGNNLHSETDGISAYDVFKKMSDIRWNGETNLTTLPSWHPYYNNFDFHREILLKIFGGIDLYYVTIGDNGYEFHQIVDFGYDAENKVYYTEEQNVNVNCQAIGNKTRYYHYFYDVKKGKRTVRKHVKSTTIQKLNNYHTIDSLYELHKVMGGIYSVEAVDGRLATKKSKGGDLSINYSENSQHVVALFMNSVTVVNPEKVKNVLRKKYGDKYVDDYEKENNKAIEKAIDDGDIEIELSQSMHDQFLKKRTIHMLGNRTAFKNEIANINSISSFYDETPLLYSIIKMMNYGIQNDSDHEADEATMKEFTLVISALTSGNRNHEYTKEIYLQLGKAALTLASEELEAIEAYRNDGNKDPLYDMVARIIIQDILEDNNNSKGLAEAIVRLIEKYYHINISHSQDKYKMPFSNANIYSLLLPRMAGLLNEKAIKRKYPGLGTVMAPGYNIMMIYDIDGRKMMFEDILREAQKDRSIKSTEDDIRERNRDIALLWLNKKLKAIIDARQQEIEQGRINILDQFALSTFKKDYSDLNTVLKKQIDSDQNVLNKIAEYIQYKRNYFIDLVNPTDNVLISYKVNGQARWLHISLNDIKEYYNFKNPDKNNHYYLHKYIAAKIKSNENTISDIWVYNDVTRSRNLAPVKISWDYTDSNGQIRRMNIFNHPNIKATFLPDAKGKYIDAKTRKFMSLAVFDSLAKGEMTIGENTFKIMNLSNTAAECIISNLYKTKFGIEGHDSLDFILLQGEDYFDIQNYELVTSDFYDLAFTKADGNHTYITFSDIKLNLEDYNIEKVYWHKHELKKERAEHGANRKTEDYIVYSRVYAMDNSNRKMFLVGRYIYDDNVTFNTDLKKYVKKGTKEAVKNLGDYLVVEDNKVVRYVEFLSKYRVYYSNGEVYTLYRINKDNVAKTLERRTYSDEELKQVPKYYSKNKKAAILTKFNSEVNNFIAGLVQNIYQLSNYSSIQINKQVSVQSHYILNSVLSRLEKRLNSNKELQNYVKYLKDVLNNDNEVRADKLISKKDGTKETLNYIDHFNYNIDPYKLRQYFSKIKYKKYTSFKKALTFTAGRIPALSMQSFMQMENVGFTEIDSGVVYVSHWLTWLLGSDYDIDKAYMMGISFDDNGVYIGWSDLFDYSTIETLQLSEHLPDPGKRGYVNNENGVDINSALKESNLVNIETLYKNANDLIEKYNDSIYNNNKNILLYLELLKNIKEDKNRKEINEKITEEKNKRSNNINERKKAINLKNQIAALRIKAYDTLIRTLNKKVNKTVIDDKQAYYVKYDEQYNEIMNNVRMHEFTTLTKENEEAALKNFISSHIQNTILDLRNMISAYSPITMKDLQDGAAKSPKGKMTDKLSMFNPNTFVEMTVQNLQGKGCVGTAANGQKAALTLNFYVQDILENGDEDALRYLKFEFITSRIDGRDNGVPLLRSVTMLPDVNDENLDYKNKKLLQGIFQNAQTSDMIISQFISAATDNAKELIIAKINAGTRLMKCYLFLATLGFDINDIIKFMTSGAVEFIDRIIELDRFSGNSFSIWDAIKIAKGQYAKGTFNVYGDFGVTIALIMDTGWFKELQELGQDIGKMMREGNVEDLLDIARLKVNEYYANINKNKNTLKIYLALQYAHSIKQLENECKQMYGNYSDEENTKEFLADVEEFEQVYQGANEFSQLGKTLSMNQGLDTSKADLIEFANNLNWIIKQRIYAILSDKDGNYSAKLKDEIKNFRGFDTVKFMRNEEIEVLDGKKMKKVLYRTYIKDFYNKIKVCINVFDVIDRVPQYHSLLDLEGFIFDMDSALAVKSRAYDFVVDKLNQKEDNPGSYMDQDYIKRLLPAIDKLLVANYIQRNLLKSFVIPHGEVTLLTDFYDDIDVGLGTLRLDTSANIASFKKLMEEYIIPDLRRGKYYYIDANGEIQVETDILDIINNPFITSLMLYTSGDTPYYSTDLDMLLSDTTPEGMYAFVLLTEGLNQLANYKINEQGYTLLDLFALYNLVVNQDRYGSNRMTKLFVGDVISGKSKIYKGYYNWLGNIDWDSSINGESENNISLNLNDLLVDAAGYGKLSGKNKNPSIKNTNMNGEEQVYLRKNSFGNYGDKITVIRPVQNESQDSRIRREMNRKAYLTLTGSFAAERDEYIEAFSNIKANDNDAFQRFIEALSILQLRSIITSLTKYCK